MYRFIKKYKFHYLIGLILAALFVYFRNDTSTDAIVETTLTAVLHDGSFHISPFTGCLIENGQYWTPMTYIYYVWSTIFEVHPAIIIKWAMPIFVMLLFITMNGMLFEEIFGKDNKLSSLSLWFLLASTLTFCFLTSIDFTGLWESPWTDRSVILYCLMPAAITVIILIFKKITKMRSEIWRIGKKGSIALFAVWGILIILSGMKGGVFLNSTFSLPDNRFKMDKEIMNIREMVESIPEVIMLAPTEVALQIQDCDEKVKLIDNPDKMADINMWDILGWDGANIVVLSKNDISDPKSIDTRFYDAGYEKLGETDNYEIYQFVSEELGRYTVTQYASVTGSPAMIYTITDWEGHLVIIDGGWKEDTDQLLHIIKDNGGKVDAWIITHPHPDHVGGFNGVYASGIVPIDVIYTIPMDYDIYQREADPWDVFEVYEEFLQLTEVADNIVYLKEGDRLSLLGLDMEVFHSFDVRGGYGRK